MSAVEVIRLFLHVLAATVWVGGQLTLAALVPVLRAVSGDAPRAAARQFRRVAWPAFGVLVVTGIWNVAALTPEERERRAVLTIKIVAVLVSGVSAFLHERATGRRALALWGALSAASALVALLYGVILAGSNP